MNLDKIKQVLQDSANLQKDLTTSTIMGSGGNTGLSRQDLESVLRIISDRNTPLRDLVKRERGTGGLVHSWNVRTTINNVSPENFVFAEDGIGQSLIPTYVQKTAAYKALGAVGAISNFAIEAGRNFIDLEAEELEVALKAVAQAEEWLILHGDSSVTNANSVQSFDGLDKSIVTNTLSSVGTFSTDVLDHLFQMIRANGGGSDPSRYVVVCSYGIQRKINQILQSSGTNTTVFVTPDQLQEGHIGIRTSVYESPIGTVRVVGDYFVNPQGQSPYPLANAAASASSASAGLTTSSIYVIDLNAFAMVDLLPLTKDPLAMYNADNWRFLVKEYTTLAMKLESHCARADGVTEPTY